MAGPNGAGKSTVAEALILGVLGIRDFVNADTLALGLSRFDAYGARVRARAVQDDWLRDLIADTRDFAFETTLASRRWVDLILNAQESGMSIMLYFLWLPSAEDSVNRVARRVEAGGHSLLEADIRGRYDAGLRNLVSLYMPVVDKWIVYDGTVAPLALVAEGGRGHATTVRNPRAFRQIEDAAK